MHQISHYEKGMLVDNLLRGVEKRENKIAQMSITQHLPVHYIVSSLILSGIGNIPVSNTHANMHTQAFHGGLEQIYK